MKANLAQMQALMMKHKASSFADAIYLERKEHRKRIYEMKEDEQNESNGIRAIQE